MTLRNYITNSILGLISGLLCALGGALKDSPYEGFQPLKFFRSPIVAAIAGAIATWFTTEPILTLAFSGYTERIACEGYKILRAQMPGKFALKDPAMLGAKFGFKKVA